MGRPRNSVDRMMRTSVSIAERGCWSWTGPMQPSGYGKATILKRSHLAHRLFYEHFRGEIPAGLQIDHLCRHRGCVNPDHLEAVTPRENTLRATTSQAAINAAKKRCRHDHVLSGTNLYLTPDGRRQCRACRRLAGRRSKERSRARRA